MAFENACVKNIKLTYQKIYHRFAHCCFSKIPMLTRYISISIYLYTYSTSPNLYTLLLHAQAAEVAKEVKKAKPDPLNADLLKLQGVLKSSLAGALTEWRSTGGSE